MGRVAFFCIPAQGHTNPTLGVVRELICRGHEVFYYSYESMRAKIEDTGGNFIPCDDYDPQVRLTEKDSERVGRDLGFSTELLVDMTLALDDVILQDMEELQPDVIVADSMACWGKLIAKKLGIPFVSSTTTFAFNQYSSREIKQGGSLMSVLTAMPRINRSLKQLRAKGYAVKSVLDIIANDNETHTIVYTAPEFQPCVETFSDKYAFVGASMRPVTEPMEKANEPTAYISMGTVLGHREEFYRSCIAALRDYPCRAVFSVGDQTDMEALGEVPPHIQVKPRVDQMAVLEVADIFITHCGMNSVNEALYHGVPMILLPQTPEQSAVASRTEKLGAGLWLKKTDPAAIRTAVETVLQDKKYKTAARTLSDAFHRCGGAKAAADKIEEFL